MNVFTYGTLMFPVVWQFVVGRAYATVDGELNGYRVLRIRDAIYPGMVLADGSHTARGVVHLDVDEPALVRLDRFEGDCYRRELVTVTCADGVRREAFAYVVPGETEQVLTDEIWTADQFLARGDLDRFLSRYAGFRRVRRGERS